VDAMNFKLEELGNMLINVLQATHYNNAPQPGPATAHTRKIALATDELRKTANIIASKATVILGARSTVWGGSQLNPNDIDSSQRFNNMSLTTGSELGEPLSIDRHERITHWTMDIDDIPETNENERKDLPPVSTVESVSSAASEPLSAIRSIESYATGSFSPGASTAVEEQDYSDDDEFELELAHNYLSLGRQNSRDGSIDVAKP
jgi:hypothetical protein